ncbi:MAG: 50S ribosomal protein L29 [Acidimicrobiia bacterium]
MSKPTELREMTDGALVERLAETKDELFKLRIRTATGQQENTARLREQRREVARINTVLREREIAAAEALEKA